jgi:hypothetical protein
MTRRIAWFLFGAYLAVNLIGLPIGRRLGVEIARGRGVPDAAIPEWLR